MHHAPVCLIINQKVFMELKEYLIEKRQSMAEFAFKLGVTVQYMWSLCNKKRVPSVFLAEKIEQLTDKVVTLNDLCGKDAVRPKCCPLCKRRYKRKREN